MWLICFTSTLAQPLLPRDEAYPWRYQHHIFIELQDTFQTLNRAMNDSVFSWHGNLLKEISDPDCKTDCKMWFAQMKVPFGDQATLYATRWDDHTWIRGVEGQLRSSPDGKLLWQGPLAFVDGGDGGTIDRRTTLHDIDRDGVLDMVMYEYEWYSRNLDGDSIEHLESERFWALCLRGNKVDSIPLLLTPLTRSMFVAPEEEPYPLDGVVSPDSLPAISKGKFTKSKREPCFLVMREGRLWGEDFAWAGTGILEDNLGRGWVKISTPDGIGTGIFFSTLGEAKSWQRLLPKKLQQHSCIVMRDACIDAPEKANTGQQADLECDCKD
jgi:hypothetical protein